MESVKCILLDIEGTVCPISFVKDTLFPYAIKSLPNFLASNWDSEEFRPYRDAFPEKFRGSPEVLQLHVEDLTKRDIKVAYLKNLQGLLWEDGYKSGQYATDLFPDVAPQLWQWKRDGYALAVYSSGSVFAQKLLFAHVLEKRGRTSRKRDRSDDDDANDITAPPPSKKRNGVDGKSVDNENDDIGSNATSSEETERLIQTSSIGSARDAENNAEERESAHSTVDLTDLFDDWFDTTNSGSKIEAASYHKIAKALKWKPEEVLFLSDNVKEVDAATDAQMQAILVDRPGNAPISDTDRQRLQAVNALSDIKLSAIMRKRAQDDR